MVAWQPARDQAPAVSEQERVSIVTFDGKLEVLLDRSADVYDLQDALDEVEEMEAQGISQYLGFTDALSDGQASNERDSDSGSHVIIIDIGMQFERNWPPGIL